MMVGQGVGGADGSGPDVMIRHAADSPGAPPPCQVSPGAASPPPEACVVRDGGICPEGWDEPLGRGVIGWQTLVSAGMTPSTGLTAGIATLEPGGFLAPHRHAPAEIYFVVEGEAMATIDGIDRAIGKGDCAYIPGMAEHGLRNVSAAPMRFLYVFPVDGFDDVTYLFSNAKLDGTA